MCRPNTVIYSPDSEISTCFRHLNFRLEQSVNGNLEGLSSLSWEWIWVASSNGQLGTLMNESTPGNHCSSSLHVLITHNALGSNEWVINSGHTATMLSKDQSQNQCRDQWANKGLFQRFISKVRFKGWVLIIYASVPLRENVSALPATQKHLWKPIGCRQPTNTNWFPCTKNNRVIY